MRLFTLIAVVLAVGVSFVLADDRPEKVAQALQERYGNVQTEIVGQPREINGIKVYEVKIRSGPAAAAARAGRNPQSNPQLTGEYQSTAQVTEFGDFLAAGTPMAFRKFPEAVQQLKELFRGDPVDSDAYVADQYYYDLKRGGENRLYRLRYDAVGRLREIINPEEVNRTETTHFQPASSNVAQKIEQLARPHAPQDAKLKNVYNDPRYSGFYVAKYVKKDGKEFLVTLNENGDIYSTRDELDVHDIPAPIRDSFDKMFDPSKLKWVYRGRDEFDQFRQQAPGGEMVTFKVRPDGTVIDVINQQVKSSEENAVTASQRQEPAQRQTKQAK